MLTSPNRCVEFKFCEAESITSLFSPVRVDRIGEERWSLREFRNYSID